MRFYFLGVIGLFLMGCSTSPVGRKQLILFPESTLAQMGTQAFADLKQKTPVERDAQLNQYVLCVSRPLLHAATRSRSLSAGEWEIVVFREDSANAFALPGKKIGVHTGMLRVAKTSAQLAAVIGHEVGHVLARHGNERVSQGLAAQGGMLAVEAFLSGRASPEVTQIVLTGLGVGAQFGYLLPHSRTQESEADLIGLDLMAQAGFDPRESVELWRNMDAESQGKQPPEWLSTHPSHESRIRGLMEQMPQAMQVYERTRTQGSLPRCEVRQQ